MNKLINKDTVLCMSLAGRPGNYGTYFHNYLFQALNLNYIYKAFTTNDLATAIAAMRALTIRGSAISMPYKEACIQFIDAVDESANVLESVNTIVNQHGRLTGYNTDYIAIHCLLTNHGIPATTPFVIKGSGGMAKAVASALYNRGFERGTILSRNQLSGERLAKQYNYRWIQDESDLDAFGGTMLINATPIGMRGSSNANNLPFGLHPIQNAAIIFDVVALPVETPLIKLANTLNKKVIHGADVAKIQALEQFVLYTGVRPDDKLVDEAAENARSNES